MIIDPVRERLEAYSHPIKEDSETIDRERCKTDLLYFVQNVVKNQEPTINDFQKGLINKIEKII